jgi:multisubunit Na+/H+ antiporter MnhC subunit
MELHPFDPINDILQKEIESQKINQKHTENLIWAVVITAIVVGLICIAVTNNNDSDKKETGTQQV